MEVAGFSMHGDHLDAQVDLGQHHVFSTWRFCLESGDQYPGIATAVAELRAAVLDAVTLTMLDAVPDTPDHAPVVRPCRICDRVTPDNAEDPRGFVFCADHRPKDTTP